MYFLAYIAPHIIGEWIGISLGISSGVYLSIYPTAAGHGWEIAPVKLCLEMYWI